MIVRIFGLISSAVFAFFTGCATKGQPGQAAREYLAFVEANPGADLRGASEDRAVAGVKNYLGNLTRETVETQTRVVYAPDVFFNDTLKTVRGSHALQEYFLETVANTDAIQVEITDVARSGNNYYFRWIMDVQFKHLQRGKTFRSIGMTHVRFNDRGQAILHQDYWDSAQGFFDHVPVLGGGTRFLKSRL